MQSVLTPVYDYQTSKLISNNSGRANSESLYHQTSRQTSEDTVAFSSKIPSQKSGTFIRRKPFQRDFQKSDTMFGTFTTHSTNTIPHSRISATSGFTESNHARLLARNGPLIFPFGEENTLVIDFTEARKADKSKEFSRGRPMWIYNNMNHESDEEDKENSAPRKNSTKVNRKAADVSALSHLAPGSNPDPFKTQSFLAPGRPSAFCPVRKANRTFSPGSGKSFESSSSLENTQSGSQNGSQENVGNSERRSRPGRRQYRNGDNQKPGRNVNKPVKAQGHMKVVGSSSPSSPDFKVDKAHPKYKTERCVNFPMGHCKFGDNCAFIHQ